MPRLLVVDDQPDIRDVIAAYLKQQGHVVIALGHDAAALRALESGAFDVMIIDVASCGAAGLRLAETAAENGIPVLVMSGEPLPIERRDRYRFLQKPFHLAALGSALRDLLHTPAQ